MIWSSWDPGRRNQDTKCHRGSNLLRPPDLQGGLWGLSHLCLTPGPWSVPQHDFCEDAVPSTALLATPLQKRADFDLWGTSSSVPKVPAWSSCVKSLKQVGKGLGGNFLSNYFSSYHHDTLSILLRWWGTPRCHQNKQNSKMHWHREGSWKLAQVRPPPPKKSPEL